MGADKTKFLSIRMRRSPEMYVKYSRAPVKYCRDKYLFSTRRESENQDTAPPRVFDLSAGELLSFECATDRNARMRRHKSTLVVYRDFV